MRLYEIAEDWTGPCRTPEVEKLIKLEPRCDITATHPRYASGELESDALLYTADGRLSKGRAADADQSASHKKGEKLHVQQAAHRGNRTHHF